MPARTPLSRTAAASHAGAALASSSRTASASDVCKFPCGFISGLRHEEASDREKVDISPQKALQCVGRRADDRFAADVERGVDDNGDSVLAAELGEKAME